MYVTNTQKSAAMYATSQRELVRASIAMVNVLTIACAVCNVNSSTKMRRRLFCGM